MYNNIPLELFVDYYAVSQAYKLWKARQNPKTTFNMHFRRPLFDGNFAVACGWYTCSDFIKTLISQKHRKNMVLWERVLEQNGIRDKEFLKYLTNINFKNVEFIPVLEGTIIFPHEPILQVRGSMIECLLLEAPLLSIMGYETMVATKAFHISQACKHKPFVEFGLRRAHTPYAALSAARASYIGGSCGTSLVAAGTKYGIPVKGTMAHAWVTSFPDEIMAFVEYARQDRNPIFLVDTYNTATGIANAIKTCQVLNVRMAGIRLDSGNFVAYAEMARKMLDEAGFDQAKILVSGDMDETEITRLEQATSHIDMYGVGTRLVTGHPMGSMGMVYKLSEINGVPVCKFSEGGKYSLPGVLRVYRCYSGLTLAYGDIIQFAGERSPGAIAVPIDTYKRPLAIHPDGAIDGRRILSSCSRGQFNFKNINNYPVKVSEEILDTVECIKQRQGAI